MKLYEIIWNHMKSYEIIWNHIELYKIISNQLVLNHIKSYQIISNQIKSHPIKSNHMKSYETISDHIRSYQIISNHIKSFQIISNHIISKNMKSYQYHHTKLFAKNTTVLAQGPKFHTTELWIHESFLASNKLQYSTVPLCTHVHEQSSKVHISCVEWGNGRSDPTLPAGIMKLLVISLKYFTVQWLVISSVLYRKHCQVEA